jgi:hypothetical protein
MTPSEGALWVIAALTAAGFGGILASLAQARTHLAAATTFFLLGACTAVLIGVGVSFHDPGTQGLSVAAWVGTSVAAFGGLPLYQTWWQGREGAPGAGSSNRSLELSSARGLHVIATGVALLAGCFAAMDLSWIAGTTMDPVSGSLSALVSQVTGTVCSAWFVLPTTAEMAVALLLVRRRLSPGIQVVLVLQVASMLAMPTALNGGVWILASSLGAGVLMAFLYAYVTVLFFAGPPLGPAIVEYTLTLVGVYALIAVGLADWTLTRSTLVLGVATLILAGLFFAAVLGGDRLAGSASAGTDTGVTAGPSHRAPV